MKHQYNVVDMFCGAGGESTGIMQAAAAQDMKIQLTAINHALSLSRQNKLGTRFP